MWQLLQARSRIRKKSTGRSFLNSCEFSDVPEMGATHFVSCHEDGLPSFLEGLQDLHNHFLKSTEHVFAPHTGTASRVSNPQ